MANSACRKAPYRGRAFSCREARRRTIVDAVFKLFNEAGKDEQVVAALDKAKLDIRSSESPAQFAAYVQSEMKRVADTATENGVSVP